MPLDPTVPRLRPGLYVGDYGHHIYGGSDSSRWKDILRILFMRQLRSVVQHATATKLWSRTIVQKIAEVLLQLPVAKCRKIP